MEEASSKWAEGPGQNKQKQVSRDDGSSATSAALLSLQWAQVPEGLKLSHHQSTNELAMQQQKSLQQIFWNNPTGTHLKLLSYSDQMKMKICVWKIVYSDESRYLRLLILEMILGGL